MYMFLCNRVAFGAHIVLAIYQNGITFLLTGGGSNYFFSEICSGFIKLKRYMIKAIFFDIDGTLVSFNTHRIPQSAVDGKSQRY